MTFIESAIEGVLIVESRRFEDDRGWFAETFSQRGFEWATFVQDNEVWSKKGVVRGLHFQQGEDAQAKLVRVEKGRILDVVVDLRAGSKTFGQWTGVELTGDNGRQLFVPRGFAHGYSVLSDEALVAYKCDNYYAPASEGGVRFDDPDIGVDWRIGRGEMVVSERDMSLPFLREVEL